MKKNAIDQHQRGEGQRQYRRDLGKIRRNYAKHNHEEINDVEMCPFNEQPDDSARPIAPVEYEFFKRMNAVSGRCQLDPMRQIHLRSRPQRATLYRASLPSGHDFHRLSNHRSPFSRAPGAELCYYFVGLLRRSQCRKRSLSAQLHCSAAFCV
jgi:hypothetical protein